MGSPPLTFLTFLIAATIKAFPKGRAGGQLGRGAGGRVGQCGGGGGGQAERARNSRRERSVARECEVRGKVSPSDEPSYGRRTSAPHGARTPNHLWRHPCCEVQSSQLIQMSLSTLLTARSPPLMRWRLSDGGSNQDGF